MLELGFASGLARGLVNGITLKEQLDQMRLQKKLLEHQIRAQEVDTELQSKRMDMVSSILGGLFGGGSQQTTTPTGPLPSGVPSVGADVGRHGPSVAPGWQAEWTKQFGLPMQPDGITQQPPSVTDQIAANQLGGLVPSPAGMANWAIMGKGELFRDLETVYKDLGGALIGVDKYSGQPTGQVLPKTPQTTYVDIGPALVGIDSRTGERTGQIVPKIPQLHAQEYDVGGEIYQGWVNPYTGKFIQGTGPEPTTGDRTPRVPSATSAGVAPQAPATPQLPGAGAIKKQGRKGLPGDTAPRVAMVQEGMRHLNEIQQIIFPKGINGPVDRTALIMMGKWAGLPAVPGSRGEVLRVKLLNALEPKIRLESGAAVPVSEIERLAERYLPKPWWDERLIRDQLTKLQQFFRSTIKAIDPNEVYQYDDDEVFWGRDKDGNKIFFRIIPPEPWVDVDAPSKPLEQLSDEELIDLWNKRHGRK